jgi:uncharacterized glyoxalase superfamily protein PhnB
LAKWISRAFLQTVIFFSTSHDSRHTVSNIPEFFRAPVSKAGCAVRRSRRSTQNNRINKEIIMQGQVRAIPEGFHTITPHLVCAGALDAIEFYKKAFGAIETGRMPGPGGKIMHAQLRIGDSPIMLADDFPEFGCNGPQALKGTPVFIHLYVNDADATWAQAVAAGAKPVMPLADMFWGDRYGQLDDPFGHRWSIATHKRDMTPQQMQEEMQKSMQQGQGCGDQQGGQP